MKPTTVLLLAMVALASCLNPRSRLPLTGDGGGGSGGSGGSAGDATVTNPTGGGARDGGGRDVGSGGDGATVPISITAFPLPPNNPYRGADFITAGPDGNVWYTSINRGTIGRVTPGGDITEFSAGYDDIQARPYDLYGIAAGTDGNLWFTIYSLNRMGRITRNGDLTLLPVLSTSTFPYGLTTGPDGNFWFTSQQPAYSVTGSDRIGRITPAGLVAEFDVPLSRNGLAEPWGITTGPDGALWFAEWAGDRIGRITTDGVITEFEDLANSAPQSPRNVTAGPDGNVWFTEDGPAAFGRIGRLTLHGVITEFSLPDGPAEAVQPADITAGPDGNLWFTTSVGKIGRITTEGVITEFPAPAADAGEGSIVTGPDGNIWFTNGRANFIGRIVPPR